MSEYLSDHVHLGDDLTSVVILDQTLLPNEVKYLTLRAPEEMFEAIQSLRVRGAPAIGICAGYCLAAIAQQRSRDLEHPRYLSELFIDLTDVAAPPAKIAAVLREEALAIHREDIAMCKSISEHGLTLLQDGAGVLTHCNAGPLATSQYGTALGPLLLGTQRGMRFRVFADETPALWAATGWPPTGTPPTRSAPAAWPSWQSTTASPSTSWAPPPPSTWTAPPGMISKSNSGTRRRSSPNSTPGPWPPQG